MSRRPSDRTVVLGCPVDGLTAAELRGLLPAIASSDDLTHLVTLNPEQVMLARSDPDVRAIVERAEIVTADGVGITLAIRLRGERPPDRITGVDVVEWIAELGLPIFFLGGKDGIAEQAAARLTERYPACRVVGWWSAGGPEPRDDDEAIRRIAESGAQVVAVAYGAPAQVRWIERNRDRLTGAGVRLAVGVGGALDYHAGAIPRAPQPVRVLGLEWLVRLMREPWRWRRQLALPVFAALAIREAVEVRLNHR